LIKKPATFIFLFNLERSAHHNRHRHRHYPPINHPRALNHH